MARSFRTAVVTLTTSRASTSEAGTITWPDGRDMAAEPLYDETRRRLVDAQPTG